MPHPSRRKGDAFEREVVRAAEAAGLRAERARGSDGRALGCSPGVDLTIEAPRRPLRVQAKRRRSIAAYLTPPDGADCTVVREDRGDSYVVLPLSLFLRLLRRACGTEAKRLRAPRPNTDFALLP